MSDNTHGDGTQGLLFRSPTQVARRSWLAAALAVVVPAACALAAAPVATVSESARQIPVATTADVVVVGGSCGAVAAAVSAAHAGARVCLLAPRSYLGEDMAGTLQLWLEPGETPQSDLARQLYRDPSAGAWAGTGPAEQPTARPLHVKQTLERALREAQVVFFLGCPATDVLTDANGRPAGVVMANRAGRQAVLAPVVIDATEDAGIARQAGATFEPFAPGPRTVRWVTIAGRAREGAGLQVRRIDLPLSVRDATGKRTAHPTEASWFEYTLERSLSNASWAARARLELDVRDATYVPSQLYTADTPVVLPAPVLQHLADDVCRPRSVERLWVVSACAETRLWRPLAAIEAGTRAGTAAAAAARAAPALTGVALRRIVGAAATSGSSGTGEGPGDVRERLDGLRPWPKPASVPAPAQALPVLGSYDVVVMGGGTAGAPAGIAAARQGARTLVIEVLHGLGGVGTLGMIGKYWYGNRVGFTKTVPQSPVEVRMAFYRDSLRDAGADVWFGTLGCGALIETQRVTGVIVATPQGRGVVLARVVIDATGNADVAAAAGAATEFVEDAFQVQLSHVAVREVGASYMNGNSRAVDVADPLDVSAALTRSAGVHFDRSPLVDSRERQRIVGDYRLDWLDVINGRTFADSLVLARSDYDSHGGQIHPFFVLRTGRPPDNARHLFDAYVPYRCLLPRDWEGILVVGLGLSAHRDALPIIRMQPDQQNLGYAAGVAAAMASVSGVPLRGVDIRSLQRKLVAAGNLPARVLSDRDAAPFPRSTIEAAVRALTNAYDGLEIVMAAPAESLPLLRAACRAAIAPADQLCYAQVLGVMGDAAGLPRLQQEAQRLLAQPKLPPPPEKGGADEVLRLAGALGGTGDRAAVPSLTALAAAIGEDPARVRAVALALGHLTDPAGAPALAKLLASEHVAQGSDLELVVADALFRCGDQAGLARRTLERIAAGNDGPCARLAWQVLCSQAAPAMR